MGVGGGGAWSMTSAALLDSETSYCTSTTKVGYTYL